MLSASQNRTPKHQKVGQAKLVFTEENVPVLAMCFAGPWVFVIAFKILPLNMSKLPCSVFGNN